MQSSITISNRLKYGKLNNNIGNALIELKTINSTSHNGMTHSFFVTLVHEVPNVDPTVITTDDDDSRSERTKSSAGNHTVFVICRLEYGN